MDDILHLPVKVLLEHQAPFTNTDVSSASLHSVIFLKLLFLTCKFQYAKLNTCNR